MIIDQSRLLVCRVPIDDVIRKFRTRQEARYWSAVGPG